MATTYIKCCGKLHEVIQFTTKGPIQYGAECSVCGRRVAAETPEDVGWKWEQMEASKPMNPKPLDAGLAERLWKAWAKGFMSHNPTVPLICTSWQMQSAIKSVAAEVRKIVKEAKEGSV